MQAQATEQNTAFRADAGRIEEEFHNAQVNYSTVQERGAQNQHELHQLETALQLSGRYDEGQYLRYEHLAVRAVRDLRTEESPTAKKDIDKFYNWIQARTGGTWNNGVPMTQAERNYVWSVKTPIS